MRVASVFWGSRAAEGGTHTFGDSVFRALREAAGESRHDFFYYLTPDRSKAPPGALTIPNARGARYRRQAIYHSRDVVYRAGLRRFGVATWFERSLAQQRIDLVWFATNYVERCDVPYVMTIFDIQHLLQPWFPEVSKDGEWESRHRHYSRYVPRATRVIVPNEAGRKEVVRHFGIEPQRVLCLAHPTPDFAREAGRRERVPRERVERLGIKGPYLLYPAQFWAHKNHATLLGAVAQLARDGGQQYELVLAGSDKGQLEHVRTLVRSAGLTDLAHILGFVEIEDLVALYQHAHALTYVSLFGPENLPPLEAFALGCPVIAADVPGAREQLGGGALLVPPTDPARLAEAVRKLEDATLREELTTQGRTRAESLTPEAYVRGVLDFLDEFEQTRRNWA